MTHKHIATLEEAWYQFEIPVLIRPKGFVKRVIAKLPFTSFNEEWLTKDRAYGSPHWDGNIGYWTLPRGWFSDTVKRSIEKWGAVYVIIPDKGQVISDAIRETSPTLGKVICVRITSMVQFHTFTR